MNTRPSLVIVDDFLPDPDAVRAQALGETYFSASGYKGVRSNQHLERVDKSIFERLLNRRIVRWEEHNMNGVFQFCTPEDPIVYHCDQQTHAAILFLTPNAPPEAGTTMWRSRRSGAVRYTDDQSMFAGGFYDPTRWEKIDQIGNVYNRLVLWEGTRVHSASCYFGQGLADARLFQIFFFDVETP